MSTISTESIQEYNHYAKNTQLSVRPNHLKLPSYQYFGEITTTLLLLLPL